MKTVTPQQLRIAYQELYPTECRDVDDLEWDLGVWLDKYNQDPPAALALCESQKGKYSRALFKALNLEWPALDRRKLIVSLL